MTKIYLLTHERELQRATGTGRLVKKVLGSMCSVIKWIRREPSEILKTELSADNTLLIYPVDDKEDKRPEIDIRKIENFILIDGTWQEARKIYNKSDYLKRFRKLSIIPTNKSSYTLRRNQKDNCLCTIESVIQIFKSINKVDIAKGLDSEFKLLLP